MRTLAAFLLLGTLAGWVLYRDTPAWDFYMAALALIAVGSVSVATFDLIERTTGGKP